MQENYKSFEGSLTWTNMLMGLDKNANCCFYEFLGLILSALI